MIYCNSEFVEFKFNFKIVIAVEACATIAFFQLPKETQKLVKIILFENQFAVGQKSRFESNYFSAKASIRAVKTTHLTQKHRMTFQNKNKQIFVN
jgi:hypothetical protein